MKSLQRVLGGNTGSEKRRKRCASVIGVIGMAMCIFALLVFLNPPVRNVTMQMSDISHPGSIRAYKSSGRLSAYFFEWAGFHKGAYTVTTKGYPIDTNAARFDVWAVSGGEEVASLAVDSISVDFMGVPISTYTGAQAYAQLEGSARCELDTDGERMLYKGIGATPYFKVKLESVPAVLLAAYIGVTALLSLLIAWLVRALCNKIHARSWRTWAFILLMPVLLMLCGMYHVGGLWYLKKDMALMNYGMLAALFVAAYAILRRLPIAAALFVVLFDAMHIASAVLIETRGRPLLPQDLMAIQTALQVAGGYQIPITGSLLFMLLISIGAVCIAAVIERRERLLRSGKLGVAVVFALIMAAGGWGAYVGLPQIPNLNWESDMIYNAWTKGTVAEFIKYGLDNRYRKPEGYSSDALEEILQEYGEAESVQGTQPARILMIMNEAFSAVHHANEELELDVTPFWDQFAKETVHGNLYVSVRGGGTCNTEFEAVTGNSLVFAPADAYPFSTLIRQSTHSLATYFDSLGYDIGSLHLHDPENWNRQKVYPLLGLSPFYSLDEYRAEYGDPSYLRGSYVSDEENYRVLKEIDADMSENPRFIFNVTLQNHGGYTDYGRAEKKFDFSQYGQYTQAETYFSLLNLSDEALQELIEFYEASEEPTMIVVFGDHQPSMGSDVDKWLFGDQDNIAKYVTPFAIWTNYGLEPEYIEAMSANYLPGLILKTGNFPLSPYFKLIDAVFEKYPILTTQGIVDQDGNFYRSIDEVPSDRILTQYAYAQYNNLFDNKFGELYEPIQ